MSKINFHIIENPSDIIDTVYDEFIELYNNPDYTVEVIKKKLELTNAQYNRVRDTALKNNHISLRLKPHYNPLRKQSKSFKYYRKLKNGRYVVTRITSRYSISITCYSEEQAQECVRLLEECDWDKSKIPIIKEKVGL